MIFCSQSFQYSEVYGLVMPGVPGVLSCFPGVPEWEMAQGHLAQLKNRSQSLTPVPVLQ